MKGREREHYQRVLGTIVYFVAMRPDIVKAFEDKIFFTYDDAAEYCHEVKLVNAGNYDKLKVYDCLVTNITEPFKEKHE